MEVGKSPSSELRRTTPSSEKLCVLCTCASENLDEEFQIFIVDLDDAGHSEPTFKDPAIVVDRKCLDVITYCVLDSTLYLFGFTTEGEYESVYTYEFPPEISDFSGKRLKRHELRRIHDMNCKKIDPIAIPTPDNKYVLAFSSFIAKIEYGDEFTSDSFFDSCCFELYDPVADLWSKLPTMPVKWRFASYSITGYSFISDHTILLQSKNSVAFTLNLLPPYDWHRLPEPWARTGCKDWSDVDVARTPLKFLVSLCGSSIYIEDSFFLDQVHAVDKLYTFDYPNLPPLYSNISKSLCATLLDAGHGEWKFCVAYTEVDSEGKHPQMIANVYLFDLAKYKEAKKMIEEQGTTKVFESPLLPGTETLKSFKFSLEPQMFPESFGAISLFRSR